VSASVWFDEVDAGLVNEIRNTVRIQSGGELVELPENGIVIRKPEEDFKIETFPCVSIYNRTYWHDPMRYYNGQIPVGYDADKTHVVMEDSAIPYNLSYQLDFWARYQTDMNTMTKTWLSKHFRQFNLNVVDSGGVERSCNALTKGSVTKSDLVQGGERLFHSIVNFEIWVEIDEEVRYNKPVVVERNVGAEALTE